MENVARYEFKFNLEDPIDAAIWQVLRPMIDRRRAAGYIREILAARLLPNDSTPIPERPMPRASRPVQQMSLPLPAPDPAQAAEADDLAIDNFMGMFG